VAKVSIDKAELMTALQLTSEEADKVLAMLKAVKGCHNGPDTVMNEIATLTHCYGTDAVRHEHSHVDSYWLDCVAVVLNVGDTYQTTIVYDTENNEFRLGCFGDCVEAAEAACEECAAQREEE